MSDIQKPRKGSLAFRPRRRARSQVPRVHWPTLDVTRLLGFAGYKAGMIQLVYVDDTNSPSKGKEVVTAATVIEVPPIYVFGIRGYKNGKVVGDNIVSDNNVLKKLGIKTQKSSNSQINSENCDKISVLVFTNPSKTSIGKKHIERMEVAVGGKDSKESFEYAKNLLGKELNVNELFKAGEYLDVIAVTKGKGWQGPAKRFGTRLQRRKATGKRRHVGTLGPFHPGYIMYTAPQAGQMGYHTRTELNKRIFKIGEAAEDINPKSGFPHYGFIRNNYIVLKGSIPGPVKRLIRFRVAVRGAEVKEPAIKEIINR